MLLTSEEVQFRSVQVGSVLSRSHCSGAGRPALAALLSYSLIIAVKTGSSDRCVCVSE